MVSVYEGVAQEGEHCSNIMAYSQTSKGMFLNNHDHLIICHI